MLSIDKQALRWVLRESAHGLTRTEQEAFDAWFSADARHRGAYLRARAIENAVFKANIPALQGSYAGLHKYGGAPATLNTSRRNFLRYGAVAAGIAAVSTIAVFATREPGLVLTTAKGEFRKVFLADQSMAVINSASQIEVNFSRSTRQLSLDKGEAWFEVAKDPSKPFIVDAGEVRVRAVGTAFSVRREEGGAEVLVTEGSVEVWLDAKSKDKRVLKAGDRALLRTRGGDIAISRQPDEVKRRLAWREGNLIFTSQPLSDAVAEFNRYSKKQIVIRDPLIKGKNLIGQYKIDAPEQFARDVGAFLGVPIEITAEKIMMGAGR